MIDETFSGSSVGAACLAAVPEVLETMFFELLADVPDVGSLPASGPLDSSRVEFEGSSRGAFVVAAPPELTGSLADSFLGLEDLEGRDANAGLVLSELANMVCGNALGRYQPNGIFRLSMPVTRLGRPAGELNDPTLTWVRFPLDGGPLYVGLQLEAAR